MHQHNTFFITLQFVIVLVVVVACLLLFVLQLLAGFAQGKAAFAMEILWRSKHQGKSCYACLSMRCACNVFTIIYL